MSFFSRVFRKDPRGKKTGLASSDDTGPPPIPRWEESWERIDVLPEEIQELVHECSKEIKSRGLELPLFLLPFRPHVDTSAAKHTVRNYFRTYYEKDGDWTGPGLQHQLRLTDPPALCSVIKWCWSRLRGGVVTWDAYELFKIGESDSHFARHAFDTFIPLSVRSQARKQIIFDFFDLLAAIAARSKTNGFGGRKLPRMAAWWAFELSDAGKGFDGGYKSWAAAADACTHLFFAYLRSLTPDEEASQVITRLPLSLQSLLSLTEYPPETPTLLQTTTSKVVMIVDTVSPTPYSLLRRAKHFEYRDDDAALQEFSSYDDPVKVLTDECCRVLQCISSANDCTLFNGTTSEPSWSKFEDVGFSTELETNSDSGEAAAAAGISRTARSNNNDGRPTTPSWADFLSTGFEDNKHVSGALLSPSDKLPPIRGYSSQSHRKDEDLEPGELASITKFDLDDTFWWVWITSLASEEPAGRKAIFGRCTLLETRIRSSRWLVIEEQVKGASPGQEEGAYIAPKRSRFGFTRRGRLSRSKKGQQAPKPAVVPLPPSELAKASIPAEQHAMIQQAAAHLREKNQARDEHPAERTDWRQSQNRTNSIFTMPSTDYALPKALTWAAGELTDVPEDSSSGTEEAQKTLPKLPILRKELHPPIEVPLENEVGADARKDRVSPKFDSPKLESPANRKEPSATVETNRSPKSEGVEKKTSPKPLRTLFKKPVPEPKISNPVPVASTAAALAAIKTIPIEQAVKNTPESPVSPLARSPTQVAAKTSAGLPKSTSPPSRYVGGQASSLNRGLRSISNKVSPPRKSVAQPSANIPLVQLKPVNRAVPQKVGSKAVPSLVRELEAAKPLNATPPQQAPVERTTPPYKASPATTVGSGSVQPSPNSESLPGSSPPPKFGSSPVVLKEVTVNSAPVVPLDKVVSLADRSLFTAGPLTDMPEFLPADDDEETMTPVASPRESVVMDNIAGRTWTENPPGSRKLVREFLVEGAGGTPAPAPPVIRVNRAGSGRRPVGNRLPIKANPASGPAGAPVNDRWAQIRRNAQERAAAKVSQPADRPSGQPVAAADRRFGEKEDSDSETSSEETIESRVARIKARVAELTGNIEQRV